MGAVVPSGAEDHIGLAVVRSLGMNNIPTTVVSSERKSLPFYSRYCSKRIITEYNDDFLSELTEDNIIMPNGEDEMLFFAKNAPFYDYNTAFPDISTLEGIFDKSQLMRFANAHHIPIPKTFIPNSPEEAGSIQNTLDFPVIIKPNKEKGGKGIVRVDSPDMIEAMYARSLELYGPSIIQEYIPFKKRYSSAALINKDYEIQRICIIQENRTYPLQNGPGCFVETVKNREIMDLTFEILEKIKIWGINELDFIIDERDGEPKFLEINPRFWGSVQCAVSAGVDFPFLLHEIAADNQVPVSYDYKAGIRSRNVISNDLRHLLAVIRSNCTVTIKMRTLIDFLKFYQDDAYFIFSMEDIRPFLSLIEYYFFKKANQVRRKYQRMAVDEK